MSLFKRCILLILLSALALTASAFAVSSSEIQTTISQVTELRTAAANLASNARTLGVEEDDYIIWYAKQQWEKYDEQLAELNKQYAAATALENYSAPSVLKGTNLGKFRISFYCPCSICNGSSHNVTASGEPLSVGTTVAVDPSVIPLGSQIYIDGIGWRIAQDTGGAIRGDEIDVLVSSHSEAYDNGIVYRDVYLK